MVKSDVTDYISLHKKFKKRCQEVCELLTPLSASYYHLDTFEIYGDEVFGKGFETYQFDYEEYQAEFPVKFLYMSDKEIKKYVENELIKRENQKKYKEEIEKQRKHEEERAEYERLKKIFEEN